MANIDFDDIREKLKDTFGLVADSTKDFAVKTAEKAKCTARIAKLSMEISGEKDTIKKAYLEIGKLYYEMHRDDPDGFFTQLCDEVTVANANIAAKEEEIAELKAGGKVGDDIEVEFTACCDDECCCDENAAEAEETTCCCECEDKDE